MPILVKAKEKANTEELYQCEKVFDKLFPTFKKLGYSHIIRERVKYKGHESLLSISANVPVDEYKGIGKVPSIVLYEADAYPGLKEEIKLLSYVMGWPANDNTLNYISTALSKAGFKSRITKHKGKTVIAVKPAGSGSWMD